jgi:hypothetical protein
MLPLSHTPNKVAIRNSWDKPIISAFSHCLGRKLAYFGLPGSDIADLLDWREYLGWRTGIEYISSTGNATDDQRRKINELQTNIMLKGLSSNWELRRGGLEDIVIEGTDVDGNRPARMVFERNKLIGMQYDIHNWDFQGGFGYKNNRSESKRIRAIESCFRLQKNYSSPFLFLVTFNVRHTLGSEIHRYLTDQEKELQTKKHKEILKWYSLRGSQEGTDRYRLKAVVTLYVRKIAEVQSIDCYCYAPIYYEGWKEHLIHFVFKLNPQRTILPWFSAQPIGDVLDLPLLEMKDGILTLPSNQHPYFDKNKTKKILSDLGLPTI